jgi:hypothetical protein
VIRKFLIGALSFAYITATPASPIGASFSYTIISKDPSHLNAYRAAITYQPPCLIWPKVQIYFDGGFGHWWVTNSRFYRNLNIYSVAPYLRYYLIKKTSFSPYVEASIGLSYLTKTRLEDRNLGIHFAFQDQVGIGTAYGPQQQLYGTLSVVHYSNGSMSSHNAGITVPLMLTMGYRF